MSEDDRTVVTRVSELPCHNTAAWGVVQSHNASNTAVLSREGCQRQCQVPASTVLKFSSWAPIFFSFFVSHRIHYALFFKEKFTNCSLLSALPTKKRLCSPVLRKIPTFDKALLQQRKSQWLFEANFWNFQVIILSSHWYNICTPSLAPIQWALTSPGIVLQTALIEKNASNWRLTMNNKLWTRGESFKCLLTLFIALFHFQTFTSSQGLVTALNQKHPFVLH